MTPAPGRGRFGPRYARSDLTWANAFTTLRFILIPAFGWLWWIGDNVRALWVFCVAALTDVLDGFLARYLNQMSRLGALLDPIADKLLMLTSLVTGVKLHVIPLWLAIIVIGRDFMLLVGTVLFATLWRGRHGPDSWIPTRLGKYAMFMQSASVVLVIFDSTVKSSPEGLRAYVEVAMLLAALLTLVAGGQYTVRAVRALAGPREAR